MAILSQALQLATYKSGITINCCRMCQVIILPKHIAILACILGRSQIEVTKLVHKNGYRHNDDALSERLGHSTAELDLLLQSQVLFHHHPYRF